MGRRPCCDNIGLNKGAWTAEEDRKLFNFILINLHKCAWRDVPEHAGLLRCGKSCRLRWVNYLRPDLKRGLLSEYEEKLVVDLHSQFGNKWSKIASHMPGRTDNEIKNLWNTHIKKKLCKMGIDPLTHKPLHADPPTDNHQNHDGESLEEAELQSREEVQEQYKDQEDGISLMLEESAITHTDDHLAKEQVAMDTNNDFLTHEVPLIETTENTNNDFSFYEIPLIEPDQNINNDLSMHEVMSIEPNETLPDPPNENTNNGFSIHGVPSIESNENPDNDFSIYEVPLIEPDETLPDPDLQSSYSSTPFSVTSMLTEKSLSTTNPILEDLKFLPSFEDPQSDGHSKINIENPGFTYEDDFTDWNWLINEFDIDKIDPEVIYSLPDPITAHEWS